MLSLLSPADLHVRRLARLGGPHVTLPGHSALVFKLPHCQVKKGGPVRLQRPSRSRCCCQGNFTREIKNPVLSSQNF